MKKNILKNIFPILFVALFSVLVVFVHLSRFYDEQIEELNTIIFPTVEEGGYSIFRADKVINLENKNLKSGVMIALKPGEEFKGKMGIKNHDDIDHKFSIWENEFERLDDEVSEEEAVLPDLVLSGNEFSVMSERVVFFEYTVKVPEETEPGEYKSQVSAKISDPSAKYIVKGPVVLELAMGVPVNLIVSNDPPSYEYQDLSQQAYDVAKLMVVNRIRYILTFILILVSLYFVFKGFAYGSKKYKK